MSDVLLVFLIGAGMLGTFMVGLAVISIWRGQLPYLSDVVVLLVAVAVVGFAAFLWFGPGVTGAPAFVDRLVTPTTYGPPPPGWTGVPQ